MRPTSRDPWLLSLEAVVLCWRCKSDMWKDVCQRVEEVGMVYEIVGGRNREGLGREGTYIRSKEVREEEGRRW